MLHRIMRVFALADDLTGALEAGAKFAQSGLRSLVSTHVVEADALVVDTETRHLPPAEAAARVEHFARQASAELVYKKTDSTLRGPIAGELTALRRVWPGRRIVYAGAYPALGRTVRDGCLLVDGVPVHETEFGRDALNPVTTSRIADILPGLGVQILDGETDGDVDEAARVIVETGSIGAGPAALAGALARQLGSPAQLPAWPRLRRVLVIGGSRHPASRAQLEHPDAWDADWVRFVDSSPGTGPERARLAGEAACLRLGRESFDAVVVFGGDTAAGLHRAFGGEPFTPIGELQPGVALSRCHGLYWITKAGGFGAPDLLVRLQEQLA